MSRLQNSFAPDNPDLPQSLSYPTSAVTGGYDQVNNVETMLIISHHLIRHHARPGQLLTKIHSLEEVHWMIHSRGGQDTEDRAVTVEEDINQASEETTDIRGEMC